MNELETLTAAQLAPILGKSEHSVRCDVHRAPGILPPRIKIPGSQRLLWLKKDVMAWLEAHRIGPDPALAPPPAPPKRKRGRPRKVPPMLERCPHTVDFVDAAGGAV